MTLELKNIGSDRLPLRPGQRIAQIVFFYLSRPAHPTYAGRYQDQTGPTAPR